jgi:hypothetical protein
MQDKDLDRLRKMLTPEQQQVAETLATLKVERDMYRRQVEELKENYDELFKIFVLVLMECPDRELRVHVSHLPRFKEEYRVVRNVDLETEEVIFKLLYVTDAVDPQQNN